MSNATTVRLPLDIKKKLDVAARQQARSKNWIIQRALDEYLAHTIVSGFPTGAQRQCKAANRGDRRDKGWEQFGD